MDQQQVRDFTEQYLRHHNCQIIETAPTHIYTQLSIEADKDLLNRPLYWMYVERMGLEPQPSHYCFIFDAENPPQNLKGEYLFYGSPRFTQLLNSAKKHGQFVRLYQEPDANELITRQSKPYTPWLLVNYFVSYICDRKKDRIFQLGIHLQTGEIRNQFYQEIRHLGWSTRLPDQRYTESPFMSISEAVGELEYYLQDIIQNEDLSWAKEAQGRLDRELEQLNLFYPSEEKLNEEQEKQKLDRRSELIWQYHPRIEVQIINAGLFYRNKQ